MNRTGFVYYVNDTPIQIDTLMFHGVRSCLICAVTWDVPFQTIRPWSNGSGGRACHHPLQTWPGNTAYAGASVIYTDIRCSGPAIACERGSATGHRQKIFSPCGEWFPHVRTKSFICDVSFKFKVVFGSNTRMQARSTYVPHVAGRRITGSQGSSCGRVMWVLEPVSEPGVE